MVRIEIPEELLDRYGKKCSMISDIMESLVNDHQFDFGNATEILILDTDSKDAFLIGVGNEEDKGKYYLRINFADNNDNMFIQLIASAIAQLMYEIHSENGINMPLSYYFQISSAIAIACIKDVNGRLNLFFDEIRSRYTMENVSAYINTITDNLNKNAIVPLNKDDYDKAKLFMDTIRTFALKYTL